MDPTTMPGKTRTTAIDVEALEFDGDTVLCRVCGDKASGFHYGVHACEGCKGFFRRSIQQKIQYRPCLKNQQCNIMRVNRNRCQYCRLKKCIAVGMSRDAVRFGRVPKKEKAKIMEQMQKVNLNSQFNYLSAILQNETNIIQQTIKSHMQTCEYTHEKFERFQKKAWQKPVFTDCPAHRACPLNPNPGGECNRNKWEDFSDSFTPAIQSVVDFAKGIPGFTVLNQEDQVTLLKAGTFEVLLLRLACMFDTQTNTMLFSNGKLYKRNMGDSSNAGFLQESMFDFAERLLDLHLHDEEIALFSSIVIISSDRPGLRNPENVECIQVKLTQGLQTMMLQNHPDDPTMFGKLLMKIPDLRTLNTLHSEKLLGMSVLPHSLRQKTDENEISPNLQDPANRTENCDKFCPSPAEMRCQSQQLMARLAPNVSQHEPCDDVCNAEDVPSPCAEDNQSSEDLRHFSNIPFCPQPSRSRSYSPPFPFNSHLSQRLTENVPRLEQNMNTVIHEPDSERRSPSICAGVNCQTEQEGNMTEPFVSLSIPTPGKLAGCGKLPCKPERGDQQKCFGDHVNGIIEQECLGIKRNVLSLPPRKRSVGIGSLPKAKMPKLIHDEDMSENIADVADCYNQSPSSRSTMVTDIIASEQDSLRREIYDRNSRRGSLYSNGDESLCTSASSTPSTARSQSPPVIESFLIPLKQPSRETELVNPEVISTSSPSCNESSMSVLKHSSDSSNECSQKKDDAALEFQRCMSQALERQRLARNTTTHEKAKSVVNSLVGTVPLSYASHFEEKPTVSCGSTTNTLTSQFRVLRGQLNCPVGTDHDRNATATKETNQSLLVAADPIKSTNAAINNEQSGNFNGHFSQNFLPSPVKRDMVKHLYPVPTSQTMKDLVHANMVSNLKDKILQRSDSSESIRQNGLSPSQPSVNLLEGNNFQTVRSILNSHVKPSIGSSIQVNPVLGAVHQPSITNTQTYPYLYSRVHPAVLYQYEMFQKMQLAQRRHEQTIEEKIKQKHLDIDRFIQSAETSSQSSVSEHHCHSPLLLDQKLSPSPASVVPVSSAGSPRTFPTMPCGDDAPKRRSPSSSPQTTTTSGQDQPLNLSKKPELPGCNSQIAYEQLQDDTKLIPDTLIKREPQFVS